MNIKKSKAVNSKIKILERDRATCVINYIMELCHTFLKKRIGIHYGVCKWEREEGEGEKKKSPYLEVKSSTDISTFQSCHLGMLKCKSHSSNHSHTFWLTAVHQGKEIKSYIVPSCNEDYTRFKMSFPHSYNYQEQPPIPVPRGIQKLLGSINQLSEEQRPRKCYSRWWWYQSSVTWGTLRCEDVTQEQTEKHNGH